MSENESSQKLQTLWEHQDLLTLVLTTAKERVVIVSPYISICAITSDNIDELVRQAVARGVRVQVFVDCQRNCYGNGVMKDRALEGIAALVHAGAQVGVCNGIQRKTLSRDNDLFAEGSFNWLSALLIRNGERQLEEGTTVYCGETAAHMISQELAEIEETEYEFATIKESEGLEVTKAGKIFCLLFVMAVPILIGKQNGNIMAGSLCAGLILAMVTGLYWLRGRRDNTLASVQQS